MFYSTLSGFLLGLSLILAIGAQNAFVLRQGLLRQHVFAVCFSCALSDAILIAVGVAGFGIAAGSVTWIAETMRWGGAAFLTVYGLLSLRRAWSNTSALAVSDTAGRGLSSTILTVLAFTWLNPHVYLDTLVLVGSISSQAEYPALFGCGAVAASFAFFFSLGYGARLLAPVFAYPAAWRIFDLAIGLTMFAIAAGLVVM
ncbi:LysE/ArgO family amino acid transporter [Seohaeicola nanhaiensis]|uniref:LysE/ArgO family amino acid transporter n=1 Tax=Seohaeicola nanhaiensis TaxID=1387282 RepID=A0ABV9KAY0_9RHOB